MQAKINLVIGAIVLVNILALALCASESACTETSRHSATTRRCASSDDAQRTQKSGSRKKVEHKFRLDGDTKLIYINETNESGYLIGEISNNNAAPRSTESSKNEWTARFFNKDPAADDVTKIQISKPSEHPESRAPTNYSVYLVSRHKEHIAILLDIEQIDFEPIINCEYQEIRLGIVGEISKQLLNKRNGVSSAVSDEHASPEDQAVADEAASDDLDQEEEPAADTYAPPLPVSEAMALLLNSPLNRTILGTDESNDFRVIDQTIDYLHDETCAELKLNTDASSNQTGLARPGRSRRRRKRGHKLHRQAQRNIKKSKNTQVDSCSMGSDAFKDLMSTKLGEYFGWDDFKIICGKTKQLVIPMRSFKLSVYSDEFSPDSKFVIKYKFISDPSLLPAHDNNRYYCRNRNIIDLDLKCNGIDDCGDASDESIKICGYPTGGRSSSNDHTSPARRAHLASHSNHSGSHSSSGSSSSHYQAHSKQRKLTYFNGDVLHCCQSSDWLSVVPQNQANQALNLQSIIDGPMSLFSNPLFAPTGKSNRKQRNRRVKRIVGGGVAQRGAWPGQVSLHYELVEPLCHFCAGTLIHPQYVLTAGHCITKEGLNRGIKVVLGAHDLRQSGDYIQVRYIDDAAIYPGVDAKNLPYDWENDMSNDIALLRLNAPVLITPHVAPACLPPFNTPLAVNTTCRSIGWGQTHGSGSSNLLKHLPLKVANSSLCSKQLLDRDTEDQDLPNNKKKTSRWANRPEHGKSALKHGRLVSESEYADVDEYSNQTMICVNNDHGHGICQGDSGGPLYCDRITSTGEKCTEVYGVASFIIQYATVGAMCAVKNLPGIFGEVSSKTEWISSTIKMFEQTTRLKYS